MAHILPYHAEEVDLVGVRIVYAESDTGALRRYWAAVRHTAEMIADEVLARQFAPTDQPGQGTRPDQQLVRA